MLALVRTPLPSSAYAYRRCTACGPTCSCTDKSSGYTFGHATREQLKKTFIGHDFLRAGDITTDTPGPASYSLPSFPNPDGLCGGCRKPRCSCNDHNHHRGGSLRSSHRDVASFYHATNVRRRQAEYAEERNTQLVQLLAAPAVQEEGEQPVAEPAEPEPPKPPPSGSASPWRPEAPMLLCHIAREAFLR